MNSRRRNSFKGFTAESIQKMYDEATARRPSELSKAVEAKQAAKPKRPGTKAQPEYKIQAAFVREMNRRHPAILVFSDTAAHIKKTQIQQVRANALSTPGEKWPDVFIAQPSGDYAGFWIEFKAESPYKKDGQTLLSNSHIEAQVKTMTKLRNAGYYIAFAWTVDMALEMVEKYLNL